MDLAGKVKRDIDKIFLISAITLMAIAVVFYGYIAWIDYKTEKSSLVESLASVFDELIQNNNLIAIKRSSTIFKAAHRGIKICLIDHKNVHLLDQGCADESYISHQVGLTRDIFRVAIELPQRLEVYYILLGMCFWLIVALLWNKNQVEQIKTSIQDDLTTVLDTDSEREPVYSEFKRLRVSALQWKRDLAAIENAKTGEKLFEQAKQVAHDIRSPLSALRVITNTVELEPAKRSRLLHLAIERIETIANELLVKRDEVKVVPNEVQSTDTDAEEWLHSLVLEKQFEFGHTLHIELTTRISNNRLALNDRTSIECLISNLMNNSFEANASIIQISFELSKHKIVMIRIDDDGHGFMTNTNHDNGVHLTNISSCRRRSGTGNGLGLGSARRWAEERSGHLKTGDSSLGGASIELRAALS